MPINKPNVSSLVPSQLPEFIREDYHAFTAFMQAYYEFLRQNYEIDLLKIKDFGEVAGFAHKLKVDLQKGRNRSDENDRKLRKER